VKKNHKRTQERFKYRNTAVMQGTINGPEKLVLIICAEFAHDDGTFWHGIRSLAKATGLSKTAVALHMKSLIGRGVLTLLSKGKTKYNSSRYRINLAHIPEEPTVYDLIRHDRLSPNGTVNDKSVPQADAEGGSLSSNGTKDIDFDLDTSLFQDVNVKSKSKPQGSLNDVKSPNQSQTLSSFVPKVGSDGRVSIESKSRAKAESKPAASKEQPQQPDASSAPRRQNFSDFNEEA
jgi:hypothetical protein